MTRGNIIATLTVLAALWVTSAIASPSEESQPATLYVDPVVVEGKRPDPARSVHAQKSLQSATFVTTVRVEDHAGESVSLVDVVGRSAGASVRSLGGLGGFSSLSVRGHAPGHTMVLIDGVPISRIATVTTDLGRFELRSFSQVELYRGGVPIGYGGSGLGGALNLTTSVGPPASAKPIHASIGGGSFGARHIRGRLLGGNSQHGTGYHAAIGYAGANGDFSYFNDNGTNLNTSDDRFQKRTNNGYDQIDTVFRYRKKSGRYTFEAGSRGLWKHQEIPGSASVQSEEATLVTWSQVASASVNVQHPFGWDNTVAKTSGYLSIERQTYNDLLGEVGLANQHRRYHSVSGGITSEIHLPLLSRHIASAAIDVRGDYFSEDDLAATATSTSRVVGSRLGIGAALADEWSRGIVTVRPALRLEVQTTDPIANRDTTTIDATMPTRRTDIYASPRISVHTRISDDFVAKGNIGRYFRAPTLLELFGDRGFIVGNPTIKPETGISTDLGIVFAPRAEHRRWDQIFFEAALFASKPRNAIVLTPTAGLATVAQNISDATLYGTEITGSARLARRITALGTYTFLITERQSTVPSFDGKRLPQRPKHQLYTRIDIQTTKQTKLWGDYTYVAANFLDAGNISRVPSRQLFGLGGKWHPRAGITVGLEAKNLTNARTENVRLSPAPRPDLSEIRQAITEFSGYPLPGRAFYLNAEWNH